MKTINERNQKAVAQSLKEMSEMIYGQNIRLDQMHQSLVSMMERLTQLEQMTIIQKVALIGLGPSVKYGNNN